MNKVCVFCGKPPENKNKEHVIPKWLMKLTETENKKVSVGTNWKTGKEMEFVFSSFTFPACTDCNTEFSNLEAYIKPIMLKVLADEAVDVNELLLLLDWFDKVRISLWLGVQYLSKGAFNMEPKYYIKSRMGLKDRLLAITNCYDNSKTLRWTGVNTLCFIMSPTCFTMKVNNILFTNCSSDFVVSEQLGFPYVKYEYPGQHPIYTNQLMTAGTERQKGKLFRSCLYPPTVIISQPIFVVGKNHIPALYKTNFIKANSYDYEKGLGKLFVTHDNITYPLEKDHEISFESKKPNVATRYKFNKPTLEFQIELLASKRYDLSELSSEQKDEHHKSLKLILDYNREQIKQYNY